MPIPTHIAIIPDGNRRWAKAKGLPAFAGHQAGAETAEKVFDAAYQAGLRYVSFWGCSISNITKRDPAEVAFLYELFERYFNKLLKSKELLERRARIRVLGFWERFFPASLQKVIRGLEEATKNFTERHLTFLLAYNGTDEMLAAINELKKAPTPGPIDGTTLKQHLFTRDLPPVDLVIRTGEEGGPHNSTGFMMWDTAEAQFYYTKTAWPDFGPDAFAEALADFNSRERRLGA